MDKEIIKGIKQGIGFVLVLFITIVFATIIVIGSGFHSASEIIEGVFQGNYTFNGSIKLNPSSSVPSLSNNESAIFFFLGNQTTYFGNIDDNATKLLIHSNTTDGSTTIVDSSVNAYTVNIFGDSHYETTNAKPSFGTSSLAFDGTGDYLTVPGSWGLGSGEFTVEFWAYHNSGTTPNTLLGTGCFSGSSGRYGWQIGHDALLSKVGFGYDFNGAWAIDTRTSYSTSSATWNHYAVTRDSSNNLRVFVNGNLVSTTSTSVNIADPTDRPLYIAGGGNDCSNYLNGLIDEVRIVIGEAKWTSAFTPESAPYNNTIPGNVTEGLIKGVYLIDENRNFSFIG